MGSSSTHYDKNAQNGLAEFFYGTRQPGTNLYIDDYSGTVTEIAASALVNRTEWYAVIRWRKKTEPDFHGWFGAVTTLSWSRGHENLHYRAEEEHVGPCIRHAPRTVLEALDRLCPLKRLSLAEQTEIDTLRLQADTRRHPYSDPARQAADRRWSTLDPDRTAREWRAACWNAVIARTERPALKHGDVIRFDRTVHFRTFTETTFEVNRPPGQRTVRFRPESQPHVSAAISNWKNLPYTIIRGA